jgi:hypothetical protein
MRAIDLTFASRDLMAPLCRECTWWQTARAADAAVRLHWEREVEAEGGFFGRALLDPDDARGDRVIGWCQVAPAHLVPRARTLPAGPPSPDSWLLLCAYFYDEEYLGGFQRLLLEIEAALKHRCVPALEAFALRHAPPDDRFHGYLRAHNLFQPDVLEGGGFRMAACRGDVARYRLELATLVASPRLSRAWERVKAPAAQPA